jgi:hypothetical protein
MTLSFSAIGDNLLIQYQELNNKDDVQNIVYENKEYFFSQSYENNNNNNNTNILSRKVATKALKQFKKFYANKLKLNEKKDKIENKNNYMKNKIIIKRVKKIVNKINKNFYIVVLAIPKKEVFYKQSN